MLWITACSWNSYFWACESKKKRAAVPRAEDLVRPGLLGKAVPLPQSPGSPGREELDEWHLLTHHLGCVLFPWISSSLRSHQSWGNSVIAEAYTSETPLNWFEVGFERESGRVQWSTSFLLRTQANDPGLGWPFPSILQTLAAQIKEVLCPGRNHLHESPVLRQILPLGMQPALWTLWSKLANRKLITDSLKACRMPQRPGLLCMFSGWRELGKERELLSLGLDLCKRFPHPLWARSWDLAAKVSGSFWTPSCNYFFSLRKPRLIALWGGWLPMALSVGWLLHL